MHLFAVILLIYAAIVLNWRNIHWIWMEEGVWKHPWNILCRNVEPLRPKVLLFTNVVIHPEVSEPFCIDPALFLRVAFETYIFRGQPKWTDDKAMELTAVAPGRLISSDNLRNAWLALTIELPLAWMQDLRYALEVYFNAVLCNFICHRWLPLIFNGGCWG